MKRVDRPIGLRQLLEHQGATPTEVAIQRLRRFMRRSERRLGVQLLFQPTEGGHCYTTLALLRRHLPEMFESSPSTETTLETLRQEIATLKGQKDALFQRVKALAAEVRGLRGDVRGRH